MAAADIRDTYFNFLLDKVKQVQFPSLQILDRIEASVRTRDQAKEYVRVLMQKNQGTCPSLGLLDRADKMIRLLELSEARGSRR